MSEERSIEVSRTARYSILGDRGTEVWFVLHGYGQLARDFIKEFESIAGDLRRIVAPEALSRFYVGAPRDGSHARASVGASWMTRENRQAEIRDYVAYLDRIYTTFAPKRAIVLGFSQGTATASRWSALGKSSVDHLILWGGGFPDDLDMMVLGKRRTRITLVTGDRDELVPAAAIEAQQRRIKDAGLSARLIRFAGGHRLDRDTLRRLAEET